MPNLKTRISSLISTVHENKRDDSTWGKEGRVKKKQSKGEVLVQIRGGSFDCWPSNEKFRCWVCPEGERGGAGRVNGNRRTFIKSYSLTPTRGKKENIP